MIYDFSSIDKNYDKNRHCKNEPHSDVPLRHDLEGIWQVTLYILHLKGVGVTDLVVRATVVGCLDHDDITAGAAELDGVTLACQLPPHQTKWHCRAT